MATKMAPLRRASTISCVVKLGPDPIQTIVDPGQSRGTVAKREGGVEGMMAQQGMRNRSVRQDQKATHCSVRMSLAVHANAAPVEIVWFCTVTVVVLEAVWTVRRSAALAACAVRSCT